MSEHKVRVDWKRASSDFSYESYNRSHTWGFEGGPTVEASAAPEFRGDPGMIDPEQAFTAAVSACHMLTLLAIAARRGLTINAYSDDAVGILARNEHGREAVTEVTLRPRIEFKEEPSRETLEKLHEQVHRGCFIANSVQCEIRIEF